MYRETKRAKERKELFSRMGKASAASRAKNREENGDERTFCKPPEVRRRITIEDFDFGRKVYVMELRRSGRIDCYDCFIDGELWKSRIGWSRALEWIRKAFVRVRYCD